MLIYQICIRFMNNSMVVPISDPCMSKSPIAILRIFLQCEAHIQFSWKCYMLTLMIFFGILHIIKFHSANHGVNDQFYTLDVY